MCIFKHLRPRVHKLKGRFCWFQSRGRHKGSLLSRLTHANETKKATHTIIFLIVVILKSFPFPSSIMLQLFWCFLNPEMAVGFVPLRAEVSLLHGFCVACLSHSWFDYSPQKSDVNNLLHAKSHARGVTLFGGMEEWRNGGMMEWWNGIAEYPEYMKYTKTQNL